MKKILPIVIVLLIALYGAIHWGLIRLPGGGSVKTLSPYEQLGFLQAQTQSKLPGAVPAITGEKGIPFASLPAKVQALFLSPESVVAVTEVALSDGKKGYKVQYSVKRKLVAEYLDFIDNFYNQGPADTNQSSRMENAAFAYLENDYWRVAANFVDAPNDSTAVTVTISLK